MILEIEPEEKTTTTPAEETIDEMCQNCLHMDNEQEYCVHHKKKVPKGFKCERFTEVVLNLSDL